MDCKAVSLESKPESDEELARQSQAGSLTAFEKLVRRYEHRLYAFVLNFCRNDIDAREVVQDTFVRAYQAIERYHAHHSFGSWLFTIARRKCIDHHRRAERFAGEPSPELADFDSPAELLAREEDRNELWKLARRRLPTRQFEALWLRYAEEMSIAEVAQVLRRTETHVKVLLFRARQTLARGLPARDRAPVSCNVTGNPNVNKVAANAMEKFASLDWASPALSLLMTGRKGSP